MKTIKVEVIYANGSMKGTDVEKLLLEELSRIDANANISDVEKYKIKGFAGIESKEVVSLAIAVAGNIGLGLFTNLIYDLLKDKVTEILVNGKKIKKENNEEE